MVKARETIVWVGQVISGLLLVLFTGSAVMKLKIASLGSDDNNVEEAVCAQ